MWRSNLILPLITVTITLVNTAKLPNYIKRCKLNDPDRLECAREAAQNALTFIVKGDKVFNLPNLMPYKVPKIQLKVGESLKMIFENCSLNGFDTIHFTHVDFDPEKRHVKFEGTLDKMNMLSNYDISGRILVLPLNGNGPSNITFVGVKFSHDVDYDLYNKNGFDYMQITNSKLKFTSDRAYYKLENLFNGDKVLGDQMNRFLDENWDEVGKEINPGLTEIVNHLITRTVKNIITKVPYKDIIL